MSALYYYLLNLEEEVDEQLSYIERRANLRMLRDSQDPFSLADSVFEANFRLPNYMCQTLIVKLMPFDRQPTSLPFSVRFFCCLNFYATGSYQRCVGNNFSASLSQSSVSRSINYVSHLIAKHNCAEVNFPRTAEQQLETKSRFYNKFGIKGVIGAIDCTHISIVAPTKSDPQTPLSLYMNRKGYYSINVEAVCNADLEILAVNPRYPGSCHDSAIWTKSEVRTFMSTQQSTWLLGDQGYPLEPWLMTPFSTATTPAEEKYNKAHCKARNVIERCFGVLKSRFRCLSKHRTLHYKHEVAAMIICACVVLHNLMMKRFPSIEVDSEEEEPTPQFSDQTHSQLRREGERVRQVLARSI